MARIIPLFTFTFALHLAASAAIPVRWTVDTFRVKPLVYECYHGETLDLAAAMTSYGDPLDLHGKTARLYWQTNGMDSVYWSTNATIKADTSTVHLSPTPTPTNVLAATFSGSFDPGAPSVIGFIGVEGENYRAAFQLNFRASPGFSPAHLPIPTPVIDFATTAVANPEASPFMVKGGSGGISAQQATNIASAVVAPATNALASVMLPLIHERVTTNDVNAIIASSNLCTVAAAEDMTNGVKAYADATFLKGDGEFQEKSLHLYAITAEGDISTTGHITLQGGWDYLEVIAQTFPQYLDSLSWRTTGNRTLANYGITDAYTKTQVDAAFAPKLTGKTYDFANGVNFTKNLYTALTNVIQTLGGTVANPPNFN